MMAKFLDKIQLKKELENLKKVGKKIVFTNGCFDILHAGHVSYLQDAKNLGDVLVIAINSDASVKRLKGEKRPLFNQDDRAEVLSALRCVDFVCIFEEDTPFEILDFLRPNIDILAKGGDYTIENIVGRELVKEVRVIPFVEDRSTTNVIQKVLELGADDVGNIWYSKFDD